MIFCDSLCYDRRKLSVKSRFLFLKRLCVKLLEWGWSLMISPIFT